MELELRPCPFCGAKAELVDIGKGEYGFVGYVICACGARVTSVCDHPSEVSATVARAWNRRAERTCRADLTEDRGEGHPWRTWECSACGGTYEDVNGRYERCPHCGARVVDVE